MRARDIECEDTGRIGRFSTKYQCEIDGEDVGVHDSVIINKAGRILTPDSENFGATFDDDVECEIQSDGIVCTVDKNTSGSVYGMSSS